MNTVAIIQARMSSTRLPGKVLLDVAGEPMLARVVDRMRRAVAVSKVVVATTTGQEDDDIVALCARRGWDCSRGSRDDVLDRYYHAAATARAAVVVRITSDCPLIDPAIVDDVVRAFEARRPAVAYATNTLPTRTFPRGLDVEVFTTDALNRAWREDRDPATREHVTPYLYRHPELFGIHGVAGDTDLSAHRWTVDTPEDLELVRRIYADFGHDRFTWQEALAVCERHPEWTALNRHVRQKVVG